MVDVNAALAQKVEPPTCNREVPGARPGSGSDAHVLALLAQRPALSKQEVSSLVAELSPDCRRIAKDIINNRRRGPARAFLEWADKQQR